MATSRCAWKAATASARAARISSFGITRASGLATARGLLFPALQNLFDTIAKSMNTENYMETASGRMVDAFNLKPEDISLEDIATGLANTCRWGGQCRRWFSVAQHSVWASRVAGRLLLSRDIRRYALLHDAHEAYMGDIIQPNRKRLFVTTGRSTDYARTFESRERETFWVILDSFELSYPTPTQEEFVGLCDRMSQIFEARAIGKGFGSDWFKQILAEHTAELAEVESVERWDKSVWGPHQAREKFLETCNFLDIKS